MKQDGCVGVCVCVCTIPYLTWLIKRSVKVGNNGIMDKARLIGINEKSRGISKDRKWRGRLIQNPEFSVNVFGCCVDFLIFRMFSVSSEEKKKKITENVRCLHFREHWSIKDWGMLQNNLRAVNEATCI